MTSLIIAGPAEVLFLAAKALSFAVRIMERWPQVDGERSRIRSRRVGGLDGVILVSVSFRCFLILYLFDGRGTCVHARDLDELT